MGVNKKLTQGDANPSLGIFKHIERLRFLRESKKFFCHRENDF